MMLPPLYCISTLLGPRVEMVSTAYCWPVSPTVTTRMMDAEPMIMPSMVSMKRALLARKLSSASETISPKTMVVWALSSVLANVPFSGAGLGTLVVAISLIRHLSVSPRCVQLLVPYPPGPSSVARRLPQTGVCGAEDRLDHRHIADGIFQRHRDLGRVQDGLRESIALQRVLIADGESLRGNAAAKQVAAGVDEQAGGAVVRRIDRDFQLDASLRAH